MNETLLFIGGCADGEQKEVERGQERARVPYMDRPLGRPLEEITRETKLFPTHEYNRIEFCGVDVMLFRDLDPSEIPRMLLSSYRPGVAVKFGKYDSASIFEPLAKAAAANGARPELIIWRKTP